jgi:hypothetical protein
LKCLWILHEISARFIPRQLFVSLFILLRPVLCLSFPTAHLTENTEIWFVVPFPLCVTAMAVKANCIYCGRSWGWNSNPHCEYYPVKWRECNRIYIFGCFLFLKILTTVYCDSDRLTIILRANKSYFRFFVYDLTLKSSVVTICTTRFNIKQFCILPTQCIDASCTHSGTISDCFPMH